MARRWPLHPPPYMDEALSSWVTRLSAAYGVDPFDFLRYEFSYFTDREQFEFLDIQPPYRLLEELAQCTGIHVSQVVSLTARSYVPLLIDSLNPTPDLYSDYTYQFNIFLTHKKPIKEGRIEDWVPWLNIKAQGCQTCIEEDKNPYFRLYWRFPWMMSCPKHGLLLRDVYFFSLPRKEKIEFLWLANEIEPKDAPHSLRRMDAMTLQAITQGITEVPRGKMHGGIWLRILRNLLEELSLPSSAMPNKIRSLLGSFWEELDLSFRHSLSRWKPFEEYKHHQQYSLMHVASLIIESACERRWGLPDFLVEHLAPILTPKKDLASVYRPHYAPPRIEECNGKPLPSLNVLMDELIEAMRKDPNEVRAFRRLIFSFNPSPARRKGIDDGLKELGIPIPLEEE